MPQNQVSAKPGFEQGSVEVLAGIVERVTFHNAENGFCVLRNLDEQSQGLVRRCLPAASRALQM